MHRSCTLAILNLSQTEISGSCIVGAIIEVVITGVIIIDINYQNRCSVSFRNGPYVTPHTRVPTSLNKNQCYCLSFFLVMFILLETYVSIVLDIRCVNNSF